MFRRYFDGSGADFCPRQQYLYQMRSRLREIGRRRGSSSLSSFRSSSLLPPFRATGAKSDPEKGPLQKEEEEEESKEEANGVYCRLQILWRG